MASWTRSFPADDVKTDSSASRICSTEVADSHVDVHLVATADTSDKDVPRVRLTSARSNGSQREDEELKKWTSCCDLAMTADRREPIR
jgi:hypothetical protein